MSGTFKQPTLTKTVEAPHRRLTQLERESVSKDYICPWKWIPIGFGVEQALRGGVVSGDNILNLVTVQPMNMEGQGLGSNKIWKRSHRRQVPASVLLHLAAVLRWPNRERLSEHSSQHSTTQLCSDAWTLQDASYERGPPQRLTECMAHLLSQYAES